MKYEKLTKVSLQNHPVLDERWVQDRIADDPAMLGLGNVIVKDMERKQQRAGRLDLLLQDPDDNHRYEVEIQLGKTDESHIIRTIEYWDIERKHYPQYEHTAVIVAEDVKSRFLNVIGLFNGMIPLVAIQMSTVRLGDTVSLLFTTVLDQMSFGLVDEDEEVQEVTDRAYWESRASQVTVAMTDDLLEILKSFIPAIELNYTKLYIGLAKDGKSNNFVVFKPQKTAIRVEPKIQKTDSMGTTLEAAGLDVMDYDNRLGRYRVRLRSGDVETHVEVLRQLFESAYQESGGGKA